MRITVKDLKMIGMRALKVYYQNDLPYLYKIIKKIKKSSLELCGEIKRFR